MLFKKKTTATVIGQDSGGTADNGTICGVAFQSPDGNGRVVEIVFDAKSEPTVGDAVKQFLQKFGGSTVGLSPDNVTVIRHGAQDQTVTAGDALVDGDVLTAVVKSSRIQEAVELNAPFRQGDRIAIAGKSGGG